MITRQFEHIHAHFGAKQDALLTRWRELARADCSLPSARLSFTDRELEDHLPALSRDLIDALGDGGAPSETIEQRGAEHGHMRRMHGYKVSQVAEEYALFRRLILETLQELAPIHPSSTLFAACELLMHLIDRSEFGSIERYVQEANQERDAARQEVRAANEQKECFLAVLSHELRNPLAAARAALHILQKEGTSESQRNRALDIIDRQTRCQTRLIDDLLDVNRISQGKIELRCETLDLRQSIENSIEAYAPAIEAKAINFRFCRPEYRLPILGDPVRIEQIVLNLLANALKFTQVGGSIEISTHRDRDNVVIRVRDTGAGFDDTMLDRLFELFAQGETSTGSGLGVGLWLAKKLTEMHGGTIRASSEGPGKGTEVTVRLPCAGKERDREDPLAVRVLLVEDNTDQREMMVLALSDGEAQIVGATDGADALAQMSDRRFDIYILDLNLPDVSGYELAGRILEHHRDSRPILVALTGYGRRQDAAKVMQAGFDHHLVKPAEIENLQRIIHSRARA